MSEKWLLYKKEIGKGGFNLLTSIAATPTKGTKGQSFKNPLLGGAHKARKPFCTVRATRYKQGL